MIRCILVFLALETGALADFGGGFRHFEGRHSDEHSRFRERRYREPHWVQRYEDQIRESLWDDDGPHRRYQSLTPDLYETCPVP